MLLHDHSSREVAFKHLQICVKLEVRRDADILIPRHILRSLEAQTWNRPQPGPPERTQSYQSSAFQSLVRGLKICQNYLRSRPRHCLASGAVRLNVYVAPSNEVLDDNCLLIEELAGDLRNVVRIVLIDAFGMGVWSKGMDASIFAIVTPVPSMMKE